MSKTNAKTFVHDLTPELRRLWDDFERASEAVLEYARGHDRFAKLAEKVEAQEDEINDLNGTVRDLEDQIRELEAELEAYESEADDTKEVG